MNSTTTPSPVARPSRVVLAVLLVVSLIGGVGVVGAERTDNAGQECPGDNPTQAYENAGAPGHLSSLAGRPTALDATECVP